MKFYVFLLMFASVVVFVNYPIVAEHGWLWEWKIGNAEALSTFWGFLFRLKIGARSS